MLPPTTRVLRAPCRTMRSRGESEKLRVTRLERDRIWSYRSFCVKRAPLFCRRKLLLKLTRCCQVPSAIRTRSEEEKAFCSVGFEAHRSHDVDIAPSHHCRCAGHHSALARLCGPGA